MRATEEHIERDPFEQREPIVTPTSLLYPRRYHPNTKNLKSMRLTVQFEATHCAILIAKPYRVRQHFARCFKGNAERGSKTVYFI